MTKYTRSDILNTAKKYVTKQRASEHGDMEKNFTILKLLIMILIKLQNFWEGIKLYRYQVLLKLLI